MALALYPWQSELAWELVAMRETLPNGLLIYGERGTGLFDLVHQFAKSLLCEAPEADGTPCGHCKGCAMTGAYTHPDLRYVVSEAEAVPRGIPFEAPDNAAPDRKNLYREILIHQTRPLGEFLTLKSHEGGRRIVLVYPADQIRAEAAAAVLKSLEEPPENTTFLLVADEIDNVLATIRSRCRLLRAQTPKRETALEWLKAQNVEDPERKLTEAGGRPLEVFETDERRNLLPEEREMLLRVLCAGPDAAVHEAIAAVPRTIALPAAAMMFSRWAYDLAGALSGVPPRYFPEKDAALSALARRTTPAKIFPWINSVRDVRRVEDHPINAKVVVEQLLLAYLRAFVR